MLRILSVALFMVTLSIQTYAMNDDMIPKGDEKKTTMTVVDIHEDLQDKNRHSHNSQIELIEDKNGKPSCCSRFMSAAWGKIKGFFKVPKVNDPIIHSALEKEMSNRWSSIFNATVAGATIPISYYFVPDVKVITYIGLAEQVFEGIAWWVHYNFLPNPHDPELKGQVDPMRNNKMQSFLSVIRSGITWGMQPLIEKTNIPIKVIFYTGAGVITAYCVWELGKLIYSCAQSNKRVIDLENKESYGTMNN